MKIYGDKDRFRKDGLQKYIKVKTGMRNMQNSKRARKRRIKASKGNRAKETNEEELKK